MVFVYTVLGKVPVEELGLILPHEHILVDYSRGLDDNTILPDGRDLSILPVTMENLGLVHRFTYVTEPWLSRTIFSIFLSNSLRPRASVQYMPCIPRARVITCLYPVVIVTNKIEASYTLLSTNLFYLLSYTFLSVLALFCLAFS